MAAAGLAGVGWAGLEVGSAGLAGVGWAAAGLARVGSAAAGMHSMKRDTSR